MRSYAELHLDHVFSMMGRKPRTGTDIGTVKQHATNPAYEKKIDEFHRDIAALGDTLDAVQLGPRDQIAVKNVYR